MFGWQQELYAICETNKSCEWPMKKQFCHFRLDSSVFQFGARKWGQRSRKKRKERKSKKGAEILCARVCRYNNKRSYSFNIKRIKLGINKNVTVYLLPLLQNRDSVDGIKFQSKRIN